MESMQRSAATRVFEDFVPPTEIVEEPQCNTLLIYLPGFKKEQLRVQLTKSRNLVISREHPIGENTWQRFKKTIPIPVNCDIRKITAKFEDLILYITQPKLIEKQDEKTNQGAEKHDDEENSFSSKTPDLDKVKEVSEHKQADNKDVERKETAQENVEKKGNISNNVVKDSNDGKNIPEVEQTRINTGEMKENAHNTYSGNLPTNMNVQKKVTSVVIAILVAIAFGLHVYYLLARGNKAAKEDL